tara:strand:- start:3336 stop:5582 length:2247 start_codon:yes stop_codon:yes gene_type:complete
MRTRWVDASGQPKYTNRLIHESSPYLRQHAHNPVDWYPWGEEAFAKAAAEDKPIFLSIGYSTCHWCHVMEHESFDDEAIAALLNNHFVSIKLDREQRPDLDEVYMTGVQLMSGQGGWPMSNFINHDAKPFFAGTYYPPQGFTSLLGQINELWQDRRADVEAQANQMSESIDKYVSAASESRELLPDLSGIAVKQLLERLDEVQGGFGGAPKFPNEPQLMVLLSDIKFEPRDDALHALTLTLDKMYQGGLCDQVGGGFHRYSVDTHWLVPHFEKMLYNQANLLRVYVSAWRLTGSQAYHRVINQTVEYVLRDMTSPDGLFYSATDADSEGEEGTFFVWTSDELYTLLDSQEYRLVRSVYGASEIGNFEGKNIFYLQDPLESYAQNHGLELESLTTQLDAVRTKLNLARNAREKPMRDEKVITAWNGMMITAFVTAGVELAKPSYVAVAENAAEALWQASFDLTPNAGNDSTQDAVAGAAHEAAPHEGTMLWRIQLDGRTSIPGNLEDYAAFAESLLNLYLHTRAEKWLVRGKHLIEEMIRLFWDEQHGGFFLSRATDSGPQISRPKSPMDGATPSGNSTALMNLVMLYEVTGDRVIEEKIHRCLSFFAGLIMASPSAFGYMISAADRFRRGSRDSVQWCCEGKVQIKVCYEENTTGVWLTIAKGWHLSASSGSSESGVGGLTVMGVNDVLYPAPSSLKTEFQTEPMDVYSGQVKLVVKHRVSVIELQLQLCSDSICLSPQRATLRLSAG